MRSLSYSPSASSLSDMPVAPYPVGSTSATLAPSSSSSDLRPEFFSGYMSSMNSSSASVGAIFSTSVVVPQSSTEQPHHVSTSTGGDSNVSPGGEVHISS